MSLHKFQGCLIGLACGDYLGMPVEFMKKEQVEKYFEGKGVHPKECNHRGGTTLPAGYYTDDTSMTICLAESLIEKGFDIKDQFLKYKKWFETGYSTPHEDRAFGVGQNTFRMFLNKTIDNLDTDLEHNDRQGGNGALMRSAPLGLYYHQDEEQLIRKTIQSSIVTHNNEISAWTCVIKNLFIRYSILDIPKEEFCNKFLEENRGEYPKLFEKFLRDEIYSINDAHTTGYSLYTLRIALNSFLMTDSYEEAINKAIMIGGDTDTQGAVTGAIAGTYYGFTNIPKIWITFLKRNDYIVELAYRMHSITTNR